MIYFIIQFQGLQISWFKNHLFINFSVDVHTRHYPPPPSTPAHFRSTPSPIGADSINGWSLNVIPRQNFVNVISRQNFLNLISRQNFVNLISRRNFVNVISRENFVNVISRQNFVNVISQQNFVNVISRQKALNKINDVLNFHGGTTKSSVHTRLY